MVNAYDWPDYYDWTSTGLDHDLTYYVELAQQTGGPVLELGCGTGRITLAIARAGIKVVGLDLSSAMLAKAKRKAEEMELAGMVEWIEGDMSRFQLGRCFPLIIIPYRSFLHLLTVRDHVETLKRVRVHLADEGLFAFNIFVPKIKALYETDGRYTFRGTFPVPGTGETVELHDFIEYDHFAQIANVIRYMERFDPSGLMIERIRTLFRLRYVYPSEINHLLNLCGFKILHRFGTFYRTPFDARSDELIIEAAKRVL
jgi:SAM-dependent methyltransferase